MLCGDMCSVEICAFAMKNALSFTPNICDYLPTEKPDINRRKAVHLVNDDKGFLTWALLLLLLLLAISAKWPSTISSYRKV